MDAPAVSRRKAGGFTLVELLTVILIMALLAGIITPAVTRAILYVYVARGIAQVSNLGNGADLYKQDHEGQYPGQDRAGWRGRYTGSQVAAACLFAYVDANHADPLHRISEPDPAPESKYAAYQPDFLASLDGRPNVLSDQFPRGRNLAVAYYPSVRAVPSAGIDRKYSFADNEPHTGGGAAAFYSVITDDRMGDGKTPHQAGRFLLIAPGIDREYFTDDDITNWP
jgi:prepilin-type N-terminal cleavage/methylation domain-containing protein